MTVTPILDTSTLPAGGPNPERFDWAEAWYPVYYLTDLDKTRPTAFTLLERDLVIWWDQAANGWRAMDDQCPHRLAPLSEGRIAEDGLLECPYHGWAFTGEGKCDRIPQQAEGGTAQTSRRACVASLPTAERQGLLFVYAGNPARAAHVPIPVIDALEESPDEWVVLNTFRDLPYDALTLLENVLDASHVPFTHHRSVGNRSSASPVELEITESNRQGFKGIWPQGPRKGTLGTQYTTFIAPNLMWHDLTSKQFGRTLTVVYATPIRKGECRLFARFPFKFAAKIPALFIKLTPRWYSHMGQNGVLEDDQIFLHLQERYLADKGGSSNFNKAFYLPTKADRFIFELHQWIDLYQAQLFPGESLPPRQTQTALLDRYHSHTEKCASCRSALANIQKLKTGAGIVGAIALILLPLLAVLDINIFAIGGLSAIALLSLAIGLGLNRLERQFYQGRAIPPRNLPDKKARK